MTQGPEQIVFCYALISLLVFSDTQGLPADEDGITKTLDLVPKLCDLFI